MTKLLEEPSISTTPTLVTPYDLRIGVTGHRDLPADGTAAIEAAVERVLDRIERTLTDGSARLGPAPWPAPSTPRELAAWLGERVDAAVKAGLRIVWRSVPAVDREVPPDLQTPFRWNVVSPLAKGADRIVARAVLARGPSPLDREQVRPRLEVVLPMPLEEYRQDFKDPHDREEFEQLYGQAAWTNVSDQFLPTEVARVSRVERRIG